MYYIKIDKCNVFFPQFFREFASERQYVIKESADGMIVECRSMDDVSGLISALSYADIRTGELKVSGNNLHVEPLSVAGD